MMYGIRMCELCGKHFKTRMSLIRHLRRHKIEKLVRR